MPLWLWLTDRQPGEGWADPDARLADTRERGYNTLRIDAMLNWVYDQQGNERTPVEVGCVVEPGFCRNSGGMTTIGGAHVQALDELLELLRLAQKHGLYFILTSWEYQPGHTTTFVADKALRDEISGIPADDKLMAHARKYDLLLTCLEHEGLQERIAFVEIHNELSLLTHILGGPEATKRHTEQALGHLQERHPGILFSGDYVGPWSADLAFDYKALYDAASQYASNTQVFDHHLYALGPQTAFLEAVGLQSALHLAGSPDFDLDAHMTNLEQGNEEFKRHLRPDAVSWSDFRQHFRTETTWRPAIYFYENLDTEAYDYWMFQHFHEFEDRMKGYWKNTIQFMGQRGRDRGLPVVCDEGYAFYSPINSGFGPSAVGRHWIEFVVDHMVDQDYWGIIVPGSDRLASLRNRILA